MLVMQVVLNTAYGSLSPRLSLNLTVPSTMIRSSLSRDERTGGPVRLTTMV